MLQEQTIYIPIHHAERTENPAESVSKRKNKTIENVKNKLLGVSLIVLGILSAAVTGDGTAAVLTLLIGLSAIFGK